MTSAKKKTEFTLQRNDKGQLFSPVRSKWVFETPEERVRQEWLCVLVNEYGYALDQMAEELDLTGRGSAQARYLRKRPRSVISSRSKKRGWARVRRPTI